MHKYIAIAIYVIFCLQDPDQITFAQDSQKPVPEINLEDGDSIVFLGDSITHQCLYTQYVENYFYTRFPKKRFKIHNAGVSGARAWDALQRFDKDVADFNPKYVTILLGMNDGEYQPFNRDVFDTYREDMTILLRKLDDTGATSILMTPTMFDSQAPGIRERTRTPDVLEEYNSVLAYFGTWLREVAVRDGRHLVDMWSPLNNVTKSARLQIPNYTLIRDGIHPDAPGQSIMASAIIENMKLPRKVSSIRIFLGYQEHAEAGASGGTLTDLQKSDDQISFSWTANSLPWVLPNETQLRNQLWYRRGHKLSRESLEVHGLSEGTYEMTIDGETAGQFFSGELDRGIELQDNQNTPQYQQALKVAELNKQRNEGPVRSMRNQWSQFQRYARAKRDAEVAPTEETRAQLAEWSKRIEGMDERVLEFIAEARKLEDQIFEINTPPTRKYVLKRVP